MNPQHLGLATVYLKPGELYIGNRAAMVITVLGSCLAVTMFSPRLHIGAISHGLFSRCQDKTTCAAACDEAFKYVDCSIAYMLKKFAAAGVNRAETEVKLFGGANVIGGGLEASQSIGKDNIEGAVAILKRERLELKTADVGGVYGRKIFFDTGSGDVFLKRLKKGLVRQDR